MRIETPPVRPPHPFQARNSPVSNDGCGLKPGSYRRRSVDALNHPSAMTGANSDGPRKVEASVRARLAPLCRSRPGSIVPVGDTRPSIESSCRPSPWSFTWRTGTAARWASPQPCGRCPGPSISNPTPGAATGRGGTTRRSGHRPANIGEDRKGRFGAGRLCWLECLAAGIVRAGRSKAHDRRARSAGRAGAP